MAVHVFLVWIVTDTPANTPAAGTWTSLLAGHKTLKEFRSAPLHFFYHRGAVHTHANKL